MSIDIKVAATGVIALCLVLAAVLFISSSTTPGLQVVGDRFFGLAVILIFAVIILGIAGIKVKFP
jgi:hypothetical protein